MNNIPKWATEKQQEGMKLFNTIAREYADFEIEFTASDHDDEDEDSRFYAIITWGSFSNDKGQRVHSFDIAYDYERTWDKYGERVYEWQFLFSGGEATREVSTEVLFLDLFFYLDGFAKAVPSE